MIVTIHQPEHLPWLGFFDKMRQVDVFVLLDTTQFAKDDFQNRNRIKTKNGPAWLTVPVFKSGLSAQDIFDVGICNDRPWWNRHRALLNESYREAPYFERYKPFFDELYSRRWRKLVELNIEIIRFLAAQLNMKCRILRASELNVRERGGTNVNLGICRLLSADVYLSGKCGKDYLDERRFAEQGIEVRYQDFQHPVYPQRWADFLPRMSAIDLLFNCGDASLQILAQGTAPSTCLEEQPAKA
jgi:hypothetical protein